MDILGYFIEHNRYMNLVGVVAILFIAILFSQKRSRINVKLIFAALGMHFLFALFMLRTNIGRALMERVAGVVKNLYMVADEGIAFLFGGLINPAGPWGFVFAIKVLPVIVFFGALMSLLFYWGIVQKVVRAAARLMQPLLGTSGAETLCAVANSVLGQTEAPLLIRHYIKNMTRSEVLLVMVSGMGTISGAILAVYSSMGVPAQHLLSASFMAIPATILIAKILLPETENSETSGVAIENSTNVVQSRNMLDAISSGTIDGLQLALNVGAMLLSFIALIGLANSVLGFACAELNVFFVYVGLPYCVPVLSLQNIFALVFAPFGWFLGLSGSDLWVAGELIGIKVTINEMVAYTAMLKTQLSERAMVLLTYALCGFSNFSCIGIQIGGIGALAPEKRQLLSELGLYAVLGGTLANLLSACVAGLLL